MLHKRIEQIARITARLEPVAYPEDELPGPPLTRGIETLVALFEKRLNALRAPGDEELAVLHVADAAEAGTAIAELCRGVPKGEMIWQGDVERPPAKRDYLFGITGASTLIASTGSVILELPTAQDGYASLLVDRHIVVASRGTLVPDLPAFYSTMSDRHDRGANLMNQVCITGCSRTADIEKLLVVPAHGPRQVRVILSRVPVEWEELRRSAAQLC